MQFREYREKMLPKLLKCLLALLIGYTIGETLATPFFSTKTIKITNAVAVQFVEASAPVVSEAPTSAKVEQSGEKSPTASDIENLIRKAFPDCPETALKIAKCESTLDYTREGDKHLKFEYNGQQYGSSFGLFQIRSGGKEKNGKIWVRSDNVEEFATDMLDAKKNIKMARKIYEESGNNFGKWSCLKLI